MKNFRPPVIPFAAFAAGEHGYGNSGIVFNDMSKRPSRYAGRGGLGAVMASKGLKFIVLDDRGSPGVEIVDKSLFDIGRKKMIEALRSHAITKPKGALNSFGTAVLINILNEAGGLPTRNFSSGRFEGAAKIAGEARSLKGTKPGWERSSTTTPAVPAVSSSVPTPGIKLMGLNIHPVLNMNPIGRWAQIAASTILTSLLN